MADETAQFNGIGKAAIQMTRKRADRRIARVRGPEREIFLWRGDQNVFVGHQCGSMAARELAQLRDMASFPLMMP